MTGWNFADIWERVAARIPDAPAQIQADRRTTWAEFDRRANGIARTLLDAGVTHQDKVALYLYNCPEYLEANFAAWKAGLVPFNTNYRYLDDELLYLWDNADAVAVVFHGAFADRIATLRGRLGDVRLWLWVDDGSGPCPEWATPYEHAAMGTASRVVAEWGRSGDDLLMIYTGGTTGLPKGVMWRQDDLVRLLAGRNDDYFRTSDGPDLDFAGARITELGPRYLPACPQMHGTGWFPSFGTLCEGGSIVTLESRSFDVEEMLDTVEREQVNVVTIVGDAFARPILQALDAEPERWDISSLESMLSAGVMWSQETKEGLMAHSDRLLLIDSFGSSEALGLGRSVSGQGHTVTTAKFELGVDARVIDDAGRDVVPGSGEQGRIAVGGFVPLGYYKDPEKSAATFIELDDGRYSMPGDWATVESDGTIILLGRGSVCINTAGEKVFPEEVEEALKLHPAVADAVVVGVPDDRFGQAVTGVVELVGADSDDGSPDFDEGAVIGHVKDRLAHYKAPRRVLVTDTIGRAVNGKVDYRRHTDWAIERLRSSG